MGFEYRLKRLSLLDQWRMDSYRIIFSIIILLIFSAIILWVLPLFSHGNTKDGFIGMFCGLSINFWLTCISRLRIQAPVDLASIVSILENQKYQRNPNGYFELNTNSFLRYKAQRIYIKRQDDSLVLTGPYNILKKVTKALDIKS